MTESELLAALEQLTATADDGRDLRTTTQLATLLAAREGVSLRTAKIRVRDMWMAAKAEGRLERGFVKVDALDGPKMLIAYRLTDAG